LLSPQAISLVLGSHSNNKASNNSASIDGLGSSDVGAVGDLSGDGNAKSEKLGAILDSSATIKPFVKIPEDLPGVPRLPPLVWYIGIRYVG
jgi:hypothetical protein